MMCSSCCAASLYIHCPFGEAANQGAAESFLLVGEDSVAILIEEQRLEDRTMTEKVVNYWVVDDSFLEE
jgi:hypothetical protein